jgi:hypothetical protein
MFFSGLIQQLLGLGVSPLLINDSVSGNDKVIHRRSIKELVV